MKTEGLCAFVCAPVADVCGFAKADAFSAAPEGRWSGELMPKCRTPIVLGMRIPRGLTEGSPRILYALFCDLTPKEPDRIAYLTALHTEEGLEETAAPLPADPPAKSVCIPNCRRRLDACPVHALDGTCLDRCLCLSNAYGVNARDYDVCGCNRCRVA